MDDITESEAFKTLGLSISWNEFLEIRRKVTLCL